jgi:hypothetical protein
MVISRTCSATTSSGEPCHAAPIRDGEFCLWHDPSQVEVVTEARRLGGARRKRETTIAGAYDVEGLDSVAAIRRVIEIAVLDGLSLDNGIARGRLLIAGALAAAKLLEVGELADRIETLERAMLDRPKVLRR